MASERGPAVFTIPVHRSFADALANGLIAQTRGDMMALARGIVLVPNNRAARAITDAFVRRAEAGLLLPRIVAVGEIGESETGLFFDSGADDVPPAIDPLARRFILARLVQQERALVRAPVDAAEALRLADGLATTLDQMIAADVPVSNLNDVDVGALSVHWEKSLALLRVLMTRWPEELTARGRIDAADRRNRLLAATADRWRDAPPGGFVVAAGITTSARQVCRLLDTVARMPGGQVVLPGVDLASPDEEWDTIAYDCTESHPQHHLRTLLDAIRVSRSDVRRWRWGDGQPRQAVRARVVSNVFAPAQFTDKWNALPSHLLKLKDVRQAEFATAADEAQGIAIALRQALETPVKTAALVTPDRALAERVVAHLKRWGIEADDSAGQPLSATPAGALVLGVAQMAAERFAPVSLLSVLKHPLVRSEGRIAWLDGVRLLDLALRGPRPAPGIAGLTARLDKEAGAFWAGIAPGFGDIEAAFAVEHPGLGDLIDAVRDTVERLAGDAASSGAAGRAAAALFDDLAAQVHEAPADFDAQALVPLLRTLMDGIAVRPPQGGHPRVSVWGLLEARLQTADLLVLGGLNEGVWPASPAPDAWLSPKIRQELGLGGIETRVGLAAHDLATALGGRDVLMTRARRDARSPTIASRFWLRIAAMTGGLDEDGELVALAQAIDRAPPVARAERPAPAPPVALRPTVISVTDVDRLQADPFAFYAKAMLKLRPLEDVDAEPDARWRGTAIHDVLDAWFRHDDCDPAKLQPRVTAMLNEAQAHPLLRTLWGPRLYEAIEWIRAQVDVDRAKGRTIVASECKGTIDFAGVKLHGRADRIDVTADDLIGVVDYKTGKPPSAKAVTAGFSMQLGLLGLIAERGGFEGVSGTAGLFEYWSLSKDRDKFGKRSSPVGGRSAWAANEFVTRSAAVFQIAADRWLTGSEPFTAKLVPEYATYEDYDQLMRRDEWYGRERK
jgi:ATP-dependent helicase/nuclease subunit B